MRRSAVQLLEKHPIDVNFFDRSEYDSFDKYLKQQSIPKTWCDELMLRRISDVVDRKIVIINENGHETLIVPQIKTQSHSQALQKPPLFLGLMTDYHYVSLVPKDDGVTTDCGHLLNPTSDDVADSDCAEPQNLKAAAGGLQYPKCWNSNQWLSFKAEYPWLTCTNGSLGCSVCATVKFVGPAGVQGMGTKNQLSSEWINTKICSYGASRADQLRSLRKKIWDHRKSSAHNEAHKTLETRDKDTLKTNVISQKVGEYHCTCAVFRTAYFLAKKNRPFTDHSALIDLQKLNGIDVGRVLHSPTTCVHIVDHISREMRKAVVQTILDSNVPFSFLIDESTTISGKSCLVVYIRCSIHN